jgi:site-specific DNA-cytosine methylase
VILPALQDSLGYQVTFGLVNAADYGVPQVRQRSIAFRGRSPRR